MSACKRDRCNVVMIDDFVFGMSTHVEERRCDDSASFFF